MKKNLSTVLLLGITVFLIVSLVYITLLLSQQGSNSATTITKTKAASHSYTRLLALNTVSPTPDTANQAETPLPSSGISGAGPSPTSPANTTPGNLTPTEILLAKNTTPGLSGTPDLTTSPNLTTTPDLTTTLEPSPTLTVEEASLSGTIIQPTTASKLPTTGWVGYPLTIFAISSVIIFLSFLF